MKYKTIYHFMVSDEIEAGNKVYCLDREDKCVFEVNDLPFENALGLIRDAKDNDRYEFWREVEEKENESE